MKRILKKNYIYVYLYNWITFAVYQKLTQYCKSTILELKKKKKKSSGAREIVHYYIKHGL